MSIIVALCLKKKYIHTKNKEKGKENKLRQEVVGMILWNLIVILFPINKTILIYVAKHLFIISSSMIIKRLSGPKAKYKMQNAVFVLSLQDL